MSVENVIPKRPHPIDANAGNVLKSITPDGVIPQLVILGIVVGISSGFICAYRKKAGWKGYLAYIVGFGLVGAAIGYAGEKIGKK